MFVIRLALPPFHSLGRVALLLLLPALSGCGETKPPAAAPSPQSAATPAPQAEASPSEAPPVQLEPGFQWIAYAECKTFPEDADVAASWSAPDERLITTTGKPKSYLYTEKEYGNFTLRYDYRFPTPPKDPAKAPLANTGVLLFIQPPHAIWPKALEVQGKYSEMGDVRPNGGAVAVPVKEDAGVRESARHAVGEWNMIEVVAKEGALTVTLNGQRLLHSDPGELTKGLIGFQAEGQAVEFRNVRVRVDP